MRHSRDQALPQATRSTVGHGQYHPLSQVVLTVPTMICMSKAKLHGDSFVVEF